MAEGGVTMCPLCHDPGHTLSTCPRWRAPARREAGFFALSLVPPWAWAALAGVVLVTTFAAGWRAADGRWQAKEKVRLAEQTQHALEASQEARRIEQARAAKVQEVTNDYATRSNRDRVAAAAARTELDGLRSALADRDRAAAAPGAACTIDAGGGLERQLLGACASALADLGGEADRLETKLTGLQRYVRAITGAASVPAP
jgi:hypothetical protein